MDSDLHTAGLLIINLENLHNMDTGDDMNTSFHGGDIAATRHTPVQSDDREDIDVPLTFFRLLIFIVGILGNLFVIFVILVLKEYRKNVTHWYVLNLAIADSLFLLTLPMVAAEHLLSGWRNFEWTCKLKGTIMFLTYYGSICFLVVMSVDRYIAVCHWRPTSLLQKMRTPTAVGIITICTWVACLLMCVPVMLYNTAKGVEPYCDCQFVFPRSHDVEEQCRIESGGDTESYEYCIEHSTTLSDQGHCIKESDLLLASGGSGCRFDFDYLFATDVTTYAPLVEEFESPSIRNPGCDYEGFAQGFLDFLWFNFIGMFIVPLIIMTVCYSLIAMRLNVNIQATNSSRNNTYVTAMCVTMVAVFVICWLPFHGVHLAKMKGIQQTSEYCTKLSQAVSLVAFANSMLNPFVYNFVGNRFVKRLRLVASTIRGCCKKQSSPSTTRVQHIYRKRTNDGGASNSQTGTVITKVIKENAQVTSEAE